MYNSVHSSKGFKGSSKNPHTPSPELVNTFNNNLGQSTQCQFIFNNRTIPLKWKDLMKIDIDLMLRKNNINDLEPHLNNLIFGTVEENDLQIASEEHVIKLIKMFQLTLKYR